MLPQIIPRENLLRMNWVAPGITSRFKWRFTTLASLTATEHPVKCTVCVQLDMESYFVARLEVTSSIRTTWMCIGRSRSTLRIPLPCNSWIGSIWCARDTAAPNRNTEHGLWRRSKALQRGRFSGSSHPRDSRRLKRDRVPRCRYQPSFPVTGKRISHPGGTRIRNHAHIDTSRPQRPLQ
jgi:hypothetical protein